MTKERQQLEATIAELEARRAILGDEVVEAALAPLRARLASIAGDLVEASPRQALKQVTIVFLDVVRSTELSEKLDPEQISDLLDGALARFSGVLHDHGGKVLKFAGDSVLAVFGAEQASEDDAERAVHAGLALLAAAAEQAQLVKARHRFDGFDVRVGVHTGDVLLGAGVDAASGIRGQSVNIAARMEQSAPPGMLRISHQTYALVRGVFEVAAQEPLHVKGVTEPISSYLVLRARPRALRQRRRGIEGLASPMVGRDAELRTLQQRFAESSGQPRPTFVTVVGEAGVGKSRLLEEFETWCEANHSGVRILRGRATPQTQGQPFALLRDVLVAHFEIPDNAPLEATRRRWEDALVPLFVHEDGPETAEGHAHTLGHLIGIDYADSRHVRGSLEDAKRIRTRAFNVAARILGGLARSAASGLVIELDDLHWADGETLDFLDELTRIFTGPPMLVLSSARPTLYERRTWGDADDRHHRIDVEPLDESFSRLLADELLRKLPDGHAALRDVLLRGSEGNPFYMEELVNMFIDVGAIRTGGDRWEVNETRLLASQVPPTLTGVLQARLDSLPTGEKLTLQEASVIGSVFWDDALTALDVRAHDVLPMLVRRQLTLPAAEAELDGVHAYSFRHHMLHQVTYNTVLKRTRQDLHRALGHWFADQHGRRANDFLSVAAEHFERAGELADAAEFHARAAEQAMKRFAHHAVVSHVQRGLALLDEQPDSDDARAVRWRLLDAQVRTLGYLGMRTQQRSALHAMEVLADVLGDDERRAHAAWRRCIVGQETADWAESERAGRQAMELAQRAGAQELRLRSTRQVGGVLALRGQPDAGRTLVQGALEEAMALGLRNVEGACLNSLSIIAHRAGDPVGSLRFNQRALALYQEIGDEGSAALALANDGAARADLGDFEQADEHLQAGLRLIRAQGDRYAESFVLCCLCSVALARADYERARALAHSTVDLSMSVEAGDWEAFALLYLGQAELGLGRHQAAQAALEQALAKGKALDHPVQHEARANLASTALTQGDIGSARTIIDALLDAAHDSRAVDLVCYRVLEAAGDARAAGWLERAHARLQTTAESISDAALRAMFLRNIPEHATIVDAWRTRNPDRHAR